MPDMVGSRLVQVELSWSFGRPKQCVCQYFIFQNLMVVWIKMDWLPSSNWNWFVAPFETSIASYMAKNMSTCWNYVHSDLAAESHYIPHDLHHCFEIVGVKILENCCSANQCSIYQVGLQCPHKLCNSQTIPCHHICHQSYCYRRSLGWWTHLVGRKFAGKGWKLEGGWLVCGCWAMFICKFYMVYTRLWMDCYMV